MTEPVPFDAVAVSAAGPSLPAMPVADRGKLSRYPSLWVDHGDLRHTIAMQRRPDREGGACFAVVRLSDLSGIKIVERFPMTEEGWRNAWSDLVKRDPASARRIQEILVQRDAGPRLTAERDRMDAESLAVMRSVIFLGGHMPADALIRGNAYDVRFLQDHAAVYLPQGNHRILLLPYASIEVVEIGGPGVVKTGGGFIGGGFGAAGAVEGMAIAALLNALTTKVTIKTVVRIQAPDSELFLLHTKLAPDVLRIELSRPLGLIRNTRPGSPPGSSGQEPGTVSVTDQLAKLASMLDSGLLTRDEFDQLKSQLITGG